MSYPVLYDVELPYRTLPGYSIVSPALQILLRHGVRTAQAVGILDSGSTHTVFSGEIASLLGIDDITEGDSLRIQTAAGSLQVHLFNMELEVRFDAVPRVFSGQVGFAAGRLPRNILGLNLVFQQFQIGFRDARQRLYLLPETR